MTRVPGSDDDVDNAAPVVEGLLLLDAAATYCALGEPVFWLRGKQPLVSKDAGGRGFHDATTDHRALVEVFNRHPGATGIGQPIAAGIFVLDVDPGKGGSESLAELEREHGPLPTTKEQATGADGKHFVLALPSGIEARQLVGIRPGIDTRAAGRGYIAVEPSLHPVTGKRYRWVRRTPPAPAPHWLLDLVRVPPPPERKPYTPPVRAVEDAPNVEWFRRRRYAVATLAALARQVASAPEGQRNDTLNRSWWRILQFVDVVPEDESRAELTRAALASGLDEREIAKVLR